MKVASFRFHIIAVSRGVHVVKKSKHFPELKNKAEFIRFVVRFLVNSEYPYIVYSRSKRQKEYARACSSKDVF